MQFVQFFQVSDCRYLQQIEIVFAGIAKIGDVAIEGETPAIVVADTAVEQQVVPPSERTRTFYGLRSHGHLPKGRESLTSRFVPRISEVECCSVASPQRVCAQAMSVRSVGDVQDAVGHAVGCSLMLERVPPAEAERVAIVRADTRLTTTTREFLRE